MAKKSRTPMPPRNVQAPRPRAAGRNDADARRNRTILFALAGSGVGLLIVVAAFIALSGGSKGKSSTPGVHDGNVAPLMTAASCTFKTVTAYLPKGQNMHLQSLTAKFPWNTDPPSNGQHYPAWAVWGFYTEPVNPRQVVHNEEHGGVILWWGSKVPKSEVDKLAAFYQASPDGMVGTPYPKLGDKIALTAWTGDSTRYYKNGYYGVGKLAVCPAFNEKAFTAFRNAYRGHGPEGIPLSADAAGTGPNG
jgi:hypothetical protein